MKSTVEISFSYRGADDNSQFELENGDPSLANQASQIVAAMNSTIAPALDAIEWPTPAPFSDAEDRAYVEAIANYASHLHLFVAELITPALEQVSPCPSRGLRGVRTRALESRRDTLPQPRFRIVFAARALCLACGPHCHIVDGKVESSCPRGTAHAPFIWTGKSRGNIVHIEFVVKYRFILHA